MAESRHPDNNQDDSQSSEQRAFTGPVLVKHAPMSERRASGIAERYWQTIRGANLVPGLSDVEMEAGATGWNDRFLIRRDRDITASVFIVCGLSARKALGMPALGRSMAEVLPPAISEEVYQACEMAGRDLRPEHLQGEFAAIDGRRVLFRSVYMPLRALSNDLGYIFGAFSARPMRR